jgi:DNA-binding SARP family transcriptional activator
MKLQQLIEQAYQTFLDEARNAQVILFHPQSQYRSVLVARLINSPEHQVFYYALGPDDIELPAFLYSMIHDLANQHPTFGRHLNMLPQVVYDNLDANFDLVLNTFVADLSELSAEPFLFILDEYDRGDTADDVQRFVEKLVERLPLHCRLIINSRTLPRLPWVSLIAQGRAVLLRDSELIRQNFYGAENNRDSLLQVYGLGPGFVLMDGQPIEAWEGHLPRLLFFFALDKSVVTRSEICQAFWPQLDPDQAVNVFHVTKRRLHKALDLDVLVHDEGYYRVNPELTVFYDVMEFASVLIAGRDENNPDRIGAWNRALELYRGPFLQGHDDAWILDRRKDFLAGYLEVMMNMAQVWLQRDRREKALSLFLEALNADFSREDLHRETMKLYTAMGRRSEAASHYQQLVDFLKTSGASPEPETQTLYNEIMT